MVCWLRQTAETDKGTTLPYMYILQTQLRTLGIQVSNVYSEPAGQVAIGTACKLTDDQAVFHLWLISLFKFCVLLPPSNWNGHNHHHDQGDMNITNSMKKDQHKK